VTTADLEAWSRLEKFSTAWTFSDLGSRFLTSVKKITTLPAKNSKRGKGLKKETPHPKRPGEGYLKYAFIFRIASAGIH
jgi:hypothetical protein